jgi:hypothetical protein
VPYGATPGGCPNRIDDRSPDAQRNGTGWTSQLPLHSSSSRESRPSLSPPAELLPAGLTPTDRLTETSRSTRSSSGRARPTARSRPFVHTSARRLPRQSCAHSPPRVVDNAVRYIYTLTEDDRNGHTHTCEIVIHTLASLMKRGRVNPGEVGFGHRRAGRKGDQARQSRAWVLKALAVHRVTWSRRQCFVSGFSLQIPLSGFAGRPERLPVHLFVAP